MKYLIIGEFSNVVGISIKTIRFYEEKGLSANTMVCFYRHFIINI